MKLSLTLLALATTANASVPSLTPDNYDELTDGKTVFLKFIAPGVPKDQIIDSFVEWGAQ